MSEVKLTGAQFKKLITLGEVQALEGELGGKNGIKEEFSFSRNGKIRPPVNLIRDDEEISLTEIHIITSESYQAEDGFLWTVTFSTPEVAALVKIL